MDNIKKYSKDTLRVERAVLPESLSIDEELCDDHSVDSYPVKVQLRYLTEEEATPAQSNGTTIQDGLFRSNLAEDDTDDLIAQSRANAGSTEVVRAKYMVGCDGAHSWTRRQLGFQLEGEPTDYIWGVLGIQILLRYGVAKADYVQTSYPLQISQTFVCAVLSTVNLLDL